MKLRSVFLLIALCAFLAVQARATRIVNYADPRNASKSIQKMIETLESGDYKDNLGYIYEALHLLRGPVPGGQGYQFARVVQDDSVEPEVLAREKVRAIHDSGKLQKVGGEASSVFKLEIHSPRHRSFFKNNGDTYVESYTLTYNLGGRTETEKKNIKVWVRNGEVYPVPLPGLVESASVEIEIGAMPNDINRTLIELRAHTPRVEDMRESPFYFAIRELLKAKDLIMQDSKKSLIRERLASALDSLGYLPSMTEEAEAKGRTNDEVVRELENILFLMGGSADDLALAKENMKKLIEELR